MTRERKEKSEKKKRRRIFCLPPVKLWRNICFVLVLAGAAAAVTGTVFIDSRLVIHWGPGGQPDGFGQKAVLWELELLAVLCMFAYQGTERKRIGQISVDREMACALVTGMTSAFSLGNVMIVTYALYPSALVPVIGSLLIIAVFILFIAAAKFCSGLGKELSRKKRGM